MQFVDEKNDLSLARLDLRQYGFEPFFKFSAEFRAGDEGAHIQRKERTVFEIFGDVTSDDTERKSFRDCRFADAGLADQTGIVLRFSGEDTDGVADLLVSADDGIELLRASERGEVLSVFGEHVVGLFGIIVGHSLVASDIFDGFFQRMTVKPAFFQDLFHGIARLFHDGEHDVLDGNIFVLHGGGDGFRFRKSGFQRSVDIDFVGFHGAAAHTGKGFDGVFQIFL